MGRKEFPLKCRRLPGKTSFRYSRPKKGPWLQLNSLEGYEWNSLELAISDLPAGLEGFRIVQIGDLHFKTRWPRELDEVIAKLRDDPPDWILFTGDFVENKHDHRPALPLVERFLWQLKAKHGMFATLGNHDSDLLSPRLFSLGVKVIIHQRLVLPIGNAAIELIGLPGIERADLSEGFVRSIPPRSPGVPRIVISHYPDLLKGMRGKEIDLYLAGHTHGGQICLPNETVILRHDSYPRALAKGAHDMDGTCLLVTRGLGFTTIPVRMFCPAELIDIKLTTA